MAGIFDMTAPLIIWALSAMAFLVGLALLHDRVRPKGLVLAGILLAVVSALLAEWSAYRQ